MCVCVHMYIHVHIYYMCTYTCAQYTCTYVCASVYIWRERSFILRNLLMWLQGLKNATFAGLAGRLEIWRSWCFCLKSKGNPEAEFFPLWGASVFFLKAFIWLHEDHPHYRGECGLISLLTWVVIISKKLPSQQHLDWCWTKQLGIRV